MMMMMIMKDDVVETADIVGSTCDCHNPPGKAVRATRISFAIRATWKQA